MRVPAPNHKAHQWTSQGSHAAESQYSAAWLPMLMTTPMKRTPLYVRATLRWYKASSRAACSTAAIFARLLEGQAQAQAVAFFPYRLENIRFKCAMAADVHLDACGLVGCARRRVDCARVLSRDQRARRADGWEQRRCCGSSTSVLRAVVVPCCWPAVGSTAALGKARLTLVARLCACVVPPACCAC